MRALDLTRSGCNGFIPISDHPPGMIARRLAEDNTVCAGCDVPINPEPRLRFVLSDAGKPLSRVTRRPDPQPQATGC